MIDIIIGEDHLRLRVQKDIDINLARIGIPDPQDIDTQNLPKMSLIFQIQSFSPANLLKVGLIWTLRLSRKMINP